jgi:CubicO group peptidase (beta-lactamase class C family)
LRELTPLVLAALAVLPVALAGADFVDWRTTIPVAATRDWPAFGPLDNMMKSFMAARNIPGAALAISRNGKLVVARGYGYADAETKEPVSPTSLFRIASVSKPLTSAAVMRLIELYPDKVGLDTPMLQVLHLTPHLAEGAAPDPRLARVTVRMLLHHTAGWDRGASFDPMFRPLEIAAALGTPGPAGPREVVRYMLGRPLDFDPGTKEVYSNFGYCVLGRIIEEVSGKSYEQFVKDEVLRPLGITRMQVGHTLLAGRAAGEVRYYDPGKGPNVMEPQSHEPVPEPYGCWHLEAMDAHGGWIASAVDLVRFAGAFDDPEHCPILKPASVAAMFARPEGSGGYEADGKPKAAYYACGWLVRPTDDGKANHWHNGSLPGTSTLLVRRHDGFTWAVLFNQRADESGLPYDDIDPAVHRAVDAVKEWPQWDLFPDLLK